MYSFFVIIVSLPTIYFQLLQAVDQSNCRKPLGMTSGQIPDEAIRSSSSHDHSNVGPIFSRKGSEKGAGAWCPKQRNESDIVDDWLEVDLQELKVVNLIETQGRFGNGQGKEYTENYRVEYRRIKGGPFIRYKDKSRRELFKGNRDTHTAEINELDPPIIARWVRILVVKTHITPCLRLELHGCVWRDGLLSYSMPQGDKRSPDNDFSDLTYDGKLTTIVVNNLNNNINNNNNISSSNNNSSNNNKLNVVLGSWSADAKNNILFINNNNNNNNNNKLNSSNIYNEDFADDSTHNRHHHHNQHFKHHHQSSQKSKQMTNNIVSSNNSPSATTTNNNNAHNSSASFVYLSGGLGQLTDGAEGHTNFRADVDNSGRKGYEWVAWRNDTASAIIGQLGSHGRPVVTLIFEFEKPRNFTSVRMHCGNRFNMDVRVFQKAILTFSFDRFDDFTTSDSTQKTSSVSSNPSDGGAGGVIFDKRESLTYIYNRDILLDFPRNVIINIGCKIGRFVKVELFFDARWIMISEIRFESEPLSENVTQEYLNYLLRNGQNPTSSSSSSFLSDQLIGVIVGAVVIPVIIIVVVIVLFISCRWKNKKTSEKLSNEDDPKLTFNLKDEIPLTKMHSNGYFTYNNTIFNNNNSNSTCNNNIMRFSNNNYTTTSSTTSTTIATTLTLKKFDDTNRILKYTLTNQKPENGTSDPYSMRLIGQRELPEVPLIPFNDTDYQSDTNTSTYAVPEQYRIAPPPSFSTTNKNRSPHQLTDPSTNLRTQNWVESGDDLMGMAVPGVRQLARSQLRLVEKLGEGLFGEVHLCDVEIYDLYPSNLIRPKKLIGAVKILSGNASIKMRDNFLQEIRVLSQLTNPNIAAILGCSCHSVDDMTYFVVIEYTCHGVMNQFLRSRSISECSLMKSKVKAWGRKGGSRGRGSRRVKPLSYGSLIYMATQVSSGMKYLEQTGIVHRDLATRNCLVGRHLSVKISDLGSYSDLYKSDYYGGKGQTPMPIRWMAWESVLLGEFTSKSDVWSFAVTLWEILTLAMSRPFNELTDQQVIDNHALLMSQPEVNSTEKQDINLGHLNGSQNSISATRGSNHVTLSQPPSCPREIYDMMGMCWCRDGPLRPSFNEIHMFLSRKNMGYNPDDDADDDDDGDVTTSGDDNDSGFGGGGVVYGTRVGGTYSNRQSLQCVQYVDDVTKPNNNNNNNNIGVGQSNNNNKNNDDDDDDDDDESEDDEDDVNGGADSDDVELKLSSMPV